MKKKLIDTIRIRGKVYLPALVPKHLPRGRVGDCFDTCLLAVMDNPDLKYVEGIAKHPLKKDKWILHAWLTDGRVAFDLTWKSFIKDIEIPVPTAYIGFEMKTDDVIDFVKTTGYKGVIANSWRDKERAKKIINLD